MVKVGFLFLHAHAKYAVYLLKISPADLRVVVVVDYEKEIY